eukprot:jgi/Psemu1/305507/fgenesh1_kg.201_\
MTSTNNPSGPLETIDDDSEYDFDSEQFKGLHPQMSTTMQGGDGHRFSEVSQLPFSRESVFLAQMQSFKEKGSYDLAEDVYAFITAAPVRSLSFAVAVAVILIKFVVYTCLITDIDFEYGFRCSEYLALIVKFFLIPVAVAMQDDLTAVFAGLANARYSTDVLEISEHATKNKYILANFLRSIDGLLSLTVNFLVMMQTDGVLAVFLNFAALHFLQDIDDVFYALIEKGFFGDDMEEMSIMCRQITWPRRRGSNKWSEFLTCLDSIFLFGTMLIMYAIYIFYSVTGEKASRGNCPVYPLPLDSEEP